MLLVVAWDGACLDLLEAVGGAKALPHVYSLMERGAVRPLRSTTPPVTFPAWTSFLTGAPPDEHGVTDFTWRPDEDYSIAFLGAADRRLPSIWSHAASAGLSVGAYGFPASYPPEPLAGGFLVPGFDTPLGAAAVPVTSPPELADRLRARYGTLAIGGPQQLRIGRDWHPRALGLLLERIEARCAIACDLLREAKPDVFAVHFQESDTVAHHFWQFFDADSARFRNSSSQLRGAVGRVYRALDGCLARLAGAAGADADVVVVSDHGSGGSADRAIAWNRVLADAGLLGFAPGGGTGSLALAARRVAGRALPASIAAAAFRRWRGAAARLESGARFAGIDWSRTRAFSEELNYFPAIWLNRRGREPGGVVEDHEVEATIDAVRSAVLALRDPVDGESVVRAVRRREELAVGPWAGRMPDLVLELREPADGSYCAVPSRGGRERRAVRRLTASEMTGARGATMSGAHRAVGLWVAAGPTVTPGRLGEARIEDAGVSVLALAGVAPGRGCRGRVLEEVRRRPLRAGSLPNAPSSGHSYDRGEAAEVAERLRDLGYIE